MSFLSAISGAYGVPTRYREGVLTVSKHAPNLDRVSTTCGSGWVRRRHQGRTEKTRKRYATTATSTTYSQTEEEDSCPARREWRRADGRDRGRRRCWTRLGTKRQAHATQSQ